MRDLWDLQRAVDFSPVLSSTLPFELDRAVIDRDEPKEHFAFTLQYHTWLERNILGFTLSELDIAVDVRNLAHSNRLPALGDLDRRELALEVVLAPVRDVLVLPMPVGGAQRHCRHVGQLR